MVQLEFGGDGMRMDDVGEIVNGYLELEERLLSTLALVS